MVNDLTRFSLDTTGKNPDNLVLGETHNLSSRPNRSIAPHHGAFFADSLVLRSGATVWARRGIDFQVVELHQEATLRYGKEIASVVLVINSEIPSEVTIDYQVLGGLYTRSDKTIANLYQSVIEDKRPVEWSNIFDKPEGFTPSIHRHLLDDIYGFEPIVDYLERIKRAITLGQTDLVLSIVESLLASFKHQELYQNLPSTKIISYDALLYFFSRRKMLYNIWVDTPSDMWRKGTEAVIQVDTSGYPVGTTLYWEFYSPDGPVALFSFKNRPFVTNGGIVDIRIYVPAETYPANEHLYIGIKENLSDLDYKATTYRIHVLEPFTTDSMYGLMVYSNRSEEDYDHTVGLIDQDPVSRLMYLARHT